jgi:hypothetical protein
MRLSYASSSLRIVFNSSECLRRALLPQTPSASLFCSTGMGPPANGKCCDTAACVGSDDHCMTNEKGTETCTASTTSTPAITCTMRPVTASPPTPSPSFSPTVVPGSPSFAPTSAGESQTDPPASAGVSPVLMGIIAGCLALAFVFIAIYRRRVSKRRSDNGTSKMLSEPLISGSEDTFEMVTHEERFPTTETELALCASHWRSSIDCRVSTSEDIKLSNRTTWHKEKVDYRVLQKATQGFDDSLQIGDGGSCTVFKAQVYGEEVAIKVLAADASGWDARQFASEVALLSRIRYDPQSYDCSVWHHYHRARPSLLIAATMHTFPHLPPPLHTPYPIDTFVFLPRHPNICRLYACSTNGPQQCLVLEYMDGGALDTRLVAEPLLGWKQRVLIAVHVCRSLAHLHSLKPSMIHRDVKCQNILLLGFMSSVLDSDSVAKVVSVAPPPPLLLYCSPLCTHQPPFNPLPIPLYRYLILHFLHPSPQHSSLFLTSDSSSSPQADFGTVRVDDRDDGKLHTKALTHASTKRIVGTGPYMAPGGRSLSAALVLRVWVCVLCIGFPTHPLLTLHLFLCPTIYIFTATC